VESALAVVVHYIDVVVGLRNRSTRLVTDCISLCLSYRQIVAEIGDYSLQCGQAIRRTCTSK